MSRKKSKRQTRRKKAVQRTYAPLFALLIFCGLSATTLGAYHFVNADNEKLVVEMDIDPNIGLEQYVTDFFTANDAPEMIPIIKCESEFRHYEKDGSVLKNRQGSSATGITQILSSVHPDPKVLKRFNKRHNTNLTKDDFDITTVEGNLGYALMLYELRGTRDWECAKKFRFL